MTALSVDLTLDGVALSSAVPEALVVVPVRPLVGERRDVFVDVPGRAGSWRFPEQPGDRSLEFKVHLLAADFEARRASVEALADWCDTSETVRLIVSDRPDRFHEVMLENAPKPDEWLLAGEADLVFRAGPYALGLEPGTETIAASGAGSDSGTFDFGGSICAEPIIEITPTNGDIETFALTIGDDTIAYEGPTIANGATVTVSTISDTVTSGINGDTELTGAYLGGLVIMSAVSGVFPLLCPPTVEWSLTWTGSATTVTITITWRERYR